MKQWIIRIYLFGLLIYSGFRVYDFVSQQLPPGNEWVALLFLLATEVGLILAHEISIRDITSEEQRNIIVVLMVVDFIGSLGAGAADMYVRQTMVENLALPATMATLLIWGLPIVVAVNVGGWLYYLYNDGETQKQRAINERVTSVLKAVMNQLKDNEQEIVEDLMGDVYGALRTKIVRTVESQHVAKTLGLQDNNKTPELVSDNSVFVGKRDFK